MNNKNILLNNLCGVNISHQSGLGERTDSWEKLDFVEIQQINEKELKSQLKEKKYRRSMSNNSTANGRFENEESSKQTELEIVLNRRKSIVDSSCKPQLLKRTGSKSNKPLRFNCGNDREPSELEKILSERKCIVDSSIKYKFTPKVLDKPKQDNYERSDCRMVRRSASNPLKRGNIKEIKQNYSTKGKSFHVRDLDVKNMYSDDSDEDAEPEIYCDVAIWNDKPKSTEVSKTRHALKTDNDVISSNRETSNNSFLFNGFDQKCANKNSTALVGNPSSSKIVERGSAQSSNAESKTENTNKSFLFKITKSLRKDSNSKNKEDKNAVKENKKHNFTDEIYFIIHELLETEMYYVESLKLVVEGYIPEMQRDDVPSVLIGQKYGIFGNVEKIYFFHSNVFLKELQEARNLSEIAQCFIRNDQNLDIYGVYNKNKPTSNSLLSAYGLFFRDKQKELGTRLDLSSELMKPTQRLAKYLLILERLVKKSSRKPDECEVLKQALETVNKHLRQGDNLILLEKIKNCDVNLKEQGQLLLQSMFHVNDNSQYWHTKMTVFLFEEIVIFTTMCKKRNQPYRYVESLKTGDIGLTDKGRLTFSLWYRKYNTKKTYTFLASTCEIKNQWVQEIERILVKQAVTYKEKREIELKEQGIDRHNYVPIKNETDKLNRQIKKGLSLHGTPGEMMNKEKPILDGFLTVSRKPKKSKK